MRLPREMGLRRPLQRLVVALHQFDAPADARRNAFQCRLAVHFDAIDALRAQMPVVVLEEPVDMLRAGRRRPRRPTSSLIVGPPGECRMPGEIVAARPGGRRSRAAHHRPRRPSSRSSRARPEKVSMPNSSFAIRTVGARSPGNFVIGGKRGQASFHRWAWFCTDCQPSSRISIFGVTPPALQTFQPFPDFVVRNVLVKCIPGAPSERVRKRGQRFFDAQPPGSKKHLSPKARLRPSARWHRCLPRYKARPSPMPQPRRSPDWPPVPTRVRPRPAVRRGMRLATRGQSMNKHDHASSLRSRSKNCVSTGTSPPRVPAAGFIQNGS